MSSHTLMDSLAGGSTATTSSNNESTGSVIPVVCHVHEVGQRYESGTEANPFRRFVRCTVSGCAFFRWVDDELTPHYLGAVQRLMQRKEWLESQLKYKTLLTEVLDEKLKLKNDELQCIRRANDLNRSQGKLVICSRSCGRWLLQV
ncbi:hypothetical protein C2S51_018789 [Perilla frutescens var. frutescens]|nr:hypothetical protein C2S51_018789 [Perilla frutescens var. frutescens]